ncbi:MAG: four helix bundle protein [Salinivirgaceae bacterium]|nr:four helix bundle protein [Salinivirgaceae bacterium]
MDDNNVIKQKSKAFALRIINMYKYLSQKNEFVMSKQVLRSGTSIGANVAEAIRAESTADFVHKLSISRKEAEETLYWLELLCETDYIDKDVFVSMQSDCDELLRILTSIILSKKDSDD